MAQIINISIDLSKVDKSQIKEVKLKSGKTAKFLNLTQFINDEQDQYGNICSISMQQSEADRNLKVPKVYVGNGKRVWADNGTAKANPVNTETPSTEAPEDDLPF